MDLTIWKLYLGHEYTWSERPAVHAVFEITFRLLKKTAHVLFWTIPFLFTDRRWRDLCQHQPERWHGLFPWQPWKIQQPSDAPQNWPRGLQSFAHVHSLGDHTGYWWSKWWFNISTFLNNNDFWNNMKCAVDIKVYTPQKKLQWLGCISMCTFL